ncbi:MAG: dipeptidase, partial [Oscillospiraceae bacterium]|nr:dipeptidase [Oscillospiraceae bacterium]
CVGSVMRLEKGRYRQTINIRYPAGMTGEELTRRLEKAAEGAACVKDIENDPPFYISAENPAIDTLLRAYSSRTGKPAQPFTMGGGTYARHFKNAVSFGMEQPKELLPPFAGPIHGADEALGEDWFFDAFLVYADAAAALQKLKF